MSWTALYDGTCSNCDGRIRAEVHQVDWQTFPDDTRTVVHTTCPDPLAIPTAGVCPRCHLTLPATGICGEC